jgi:hypothetical protein
MEANRLPAHEGIRAPNPAQTTTEQHLVEVKMVQINTRRLIAATLAALGIFIAGGREARAGISLASPAISIKGTIVVVGGGGNGTDPIYTYEFDAVLNASLTVDANPPPFYHGPVTSFTVDNLVGIPSTLTSSSSGVVGGSWAPYITATNPDGTTDVTWYYSGPQITNPSSTSGEDLGTFGINTINYANPSLSLLPNSVPYSYSLNGGPDTDGPSITLQGGGLTTDAIAVPEPSTAIAPLIVLLALPLVMLVKRRWTRGSLQAA